MKYYSEKQFLEEMHEKHINDASKTWNQDSVKIREMVEKYHHVQYTPIDTGNIDVPQDFVDWFFDSAKLNSCPFPIWDKNWLSVYKKADYDFSYLGSAQNKDLSLYPDIKDMFVHLFEQLEEQLPYEKLESFNISSNVKDIILHRDPFYLISLPISYRVMLYDENTEGTYNHIQYLPTDEVIEFKDDAYIDHESFRNGVFGKSAMHQPENGQSFVYNNFTTKHSAAKHEDKKKILFIPRMSNPIEWDKFEEQIQRSMEKYKDSILLDDKKLEDYFE